jgi:hypothetical protein
VFYKKENGEEEKGHSLEHVYTVLYWLSLPWKNYVV